MPSIEPSPGREPEVSVVLPTFREALTLPLVIPQLAGVLEESSLSAEVLVVDDASPDGTAEVARRLAETFPVRVLEREGERGLATAVLAGFQAARGEICVVMDADGSHPPETVPALVARVRSGDAEIAVGSRHLDGGGFRSGSLSSRLISRFAATFARRLSPLTDPTSGFMAIRKELLDDLDLDPVGWKIVLEIVVKAQPRPVAEVPILFDPRRAGHSKQSPRVFLEYLLHCWRLRHYRQRERHRPRS